MPNAAPPQTFSLLDTARGPLWAGHAGAGEDVLLVSGLGDTHEIWADVVPLLTEDRRVISFDNPGVGRSPLGADGPSVPGFARDALALMDRLGIECAHVIGSSMGGAIAQELALAAPERVASIVLAGTWARPDLHLTRLLRHLSRLLVLIEDPDEQFEAMGLWVYSGRAHTDGTVAQLIEFMGRSTSPPQSADVFALTAEGAIAHDAADRLAAITAPTLVLVGSEDRICPMRLSHELHTLIAGSRLRVIDGRGHQPFQEDPAGFVGLVREFWTEV